MQNHQLQRNDSETQEKIIHNSQLSIHNSQLDRPDPERMRPSDVPLLVGDSSKFRRQTGWEPTIPFEQTLRDMLAYWRRQIMQVCLEAWGAR